jgi:altronate dehydratase large subunit
LRLKGFMRADGKAGIRNKVLILPTVACSAEAARIIADHVSGCVSISNQQGCGQMGLDAQRTINTLIGLGKNPNVYGVVVVGLGCEVAQPQIIADGIAESGKPVKTVIIQQQGGLWASIATGIKHATQMAQDMSRQKPDDISISDLVVALECGGSDPTSGIASNPAVGWASDMIVKSGGTVILSETTEFIGAEHILAARAASEQVASDILRIVSNLEDQVKKMGGNLRGSNPSPGNIAGGLSSIEEKSLGCIYKGGTTAVNEVIEYAAQPEKKGLVIMDSPGQDIDSMTGMAASGAQICAFTTGRGTPVGNPIMPVIKITGNPFTYDKMHDFIDINAGEILRGEASIEQMGQIIFNEIMDVVNGKITKAEAFGFSEISIWRCGISI